MTAVAASTPTTVLSHGAGVYTVTSSLAAPQALPPGTYGINFNPMTGYSISTLPDLQPPSYRVYGRRDETIAKVLNTYGHLDRSLGVLFEGDKGIGKSSTTVELARQARDLFNMPVIMVTRDTPDLPRFLASLGECVIVFDEFEKVFPRNGEEGDRQAQFLSLFDGTDAAKRLYIITVNDTTKLSPYLLNRPGRFHYLISFDYPDAEAVQQYVTNEAPDASPQQVADVVSFAYRARLNYDHLRAIVTELEIAGPNEPVSDLVADLNIRDTDDLYFDIAVHLEDGTTLTTFNDEVDIFGDRAGVMLSIPHKGKREGLYPAWMSVFFDPSKGVLSKNGLLVREVTGTVLTLKTKKEAENYARLADWERELIAETSSSCEVDLMDNPPEAYHGLRVTRVELTPAKVTHDRFAF